LPGGASASVKATRQAAQIAIVFFTQILPMNADSRRPLILNYDGRPVPDS
jgi:hypothetical protein